MNLRTPGHTASACAYSSSTICSGENSIRNRCASYPSGPNKPGFSFRVVAVRMIRRIWSVEIQGIARLRASARATVDLPAVGAPPMRNTLRGGMSISTPLDTETIDLLQIKRLTYQASLSTSRSRTAQTPVHPRFAPALSILLVPQITDRGLPKDRHCD